MSESQKLPTVDQIAAAQKLYVHEKMEYWRHEDIILTKLREKDPDSGLTDPQRTLIKVTLVNSFYNARCPDVEQVTSWIVDQKPNLSDRNIGSNDDVERIELVHDIAAHGRNANSIVFASKFAHFFIDPDVFPIYDQYARMLVHFHVDTLEGDEPPRSRYGKFFKKFLRLKQLLQQRDSVSYSTKELDCYLWSAGQYITWKKGCFPNGFFYLNERLPFDNPLYEELFPQGRIEGVPDDILLRELDWADTKRQEAWKRRREEKSSGPQT